MNRRFKRILIVPLVLCLPLLLSASALALAENPEGSTIDELNEIPLEINNGTVITNNDHIAYNYGTVVNNNNHIENNFGIIECNYGTVGKNYGIIQKSVGNASVGTQYYPLTLTGDPNAGIDMLISVEQIDGTYWISEDGGAVHIGLKDTAPIDSGLYELKLSYILPDGCTVSYEGPNFPGFYDVTGAIEICAELVPLYTADETIPATGDSAAPLFLAGIMLLSILGMTLLRKQQNN